MTSSPTQQHQIPPTDVVKVNFPNPEMRDGVKEPYRAEFSSQQAIDAVVHSANRTLLLVSGGEKAGDEGMLEGAGVKWRRARRA